MSQARSILSLDVAAQWLGDRFKCFEWDLRTASLFGSIVRCDVQTIGDVDLLLIIGSSAQSAVRACATDIATLRSDFHATFNTSLHVTVINVAEDEKLHYFL